MLDSALDDDAVIRLSLADGERFAAMYDRHAPPVPEVSPQPCGS
jgi:hypothetical protein